MKIQQLKINNYGKIKEKEISFGNHINIIYGRNESGKSTILRYIVNSLYGISKNKKGKEYSDFEKYEPWIGEEFAGRLSYQLDNGNKYEIYRDFRKKNPKIFNENMEDISKQFTIDKTAGNAFFYDQTKVDEQLFLTTFVSSQQEIHLQKSEQGMLIQKIANLVGTGEDSVSYKIAIDRINRRQLEEIGTSRTREKPINIINNKITQLEQQKANLEEYQEKQCITEEKEQQIIAQIQKLEYEFKALKELKMLNEEQTIKKKEILLKENIRKQNLKKIREIDNNLENIHIENRDILEEYETEKKAETQANVNLHININENSEKQNNKGLKILLVIATICIIIGSILLKNSIINYTIFALSTVSILVTGVIVIKKQKEKEKLKNSKLLLKREKLQKYEILKEKIKLFEREIQILEKNNNEIQYQIEDYQKEMKNKIEEQKSEIIKKYKQLSTNKIKEITENNINYKIQDIQDSISNKKIELHTIQIDKNNNLSKLEALAQIEEQCSNCYEQKQELEKLNSSMIIAKQMLENCYEKMRHTVTPKLTQNLSKNMAQITNGKYKNISFHDENGLIVENENGEYVSASKLSIGTIEQLYLSLRLSMIDDLSEEKLPIILDETFAYFDDERLQNFLTYIDKAYADRQILIFTSTHREQETCDKNQIVYKLNSLP